MSDRAGSPASPTGPTRLARTTSQALADRVGAGLYDLEVVDTSRISASMRRLVLSAEGLSTFSYQAGQDLMVSVGKVGDSTVRRRYTIRAFDSTARRVTLDVLLHGDGPGARWATSAGPGDHLEAIGPRGKVTLDGSARTHLFVGDEAFAPAAFVMTEARPPGTRSIILIEVDSKEDQLGLELPGPNDRLRWVHRSGPDGLESSGADGARLLSAMAEIEIDPSGAHAYVGGELRTVSALRQALLAMGFAADQLSTKPYWRAGSANANHGEPDRE